MHIFRAGLLLAAITGIGVTWAAWSAGDLVEIALVRGLLGMMAVAFLGYVGELVVLTAPGDIAAQSELEARTTARGGTGGGRGRPGSGATQATAANNAVMSGARMDADAADPRTEADPGASREAA
jgi:hypothetical protein